MTEGLFVFLLMVIVFSIMALAIMTGKFDAFILRNSRWKEI